MGEEKKGLLTNNFFLEDIRTKEHKSIKTLEQKNKRNPYIK